MLLLNRWSPHRYSFVGFAWWSLGAKEGRPKFTVTAQKKLTSISYCAILPTTPKALSCYNAIIFSNVGQLETVFQ
jgi:hypothetical protein